MVASEGLPPSAIIRKGPTSWRRPSISKRGDLAQKVAERLPASCRCCSTVARRREDTGSRPPPANPRTSYRRRCAGRLDHRPPAGSRASARPGDRQPAVAAPHRPGHRRHAQRFRRPRGTTNASRAARLAGRRIDSRRLAAQADPQADHAQRRLPREPRLRRAPRRGRPRQQAVLAHRARGCEAEAIRDALLAASGTLDETMFGSGTLDECSAAGAFISPSSAAN